MNLPAEDRLRSLALTNISPYWILLAVVAGMFGVKGAVTVVSMSKGVTDQYSQDQPHRQDYWRWYKIARKSLAGEDLAEADGGRYFDVPATTTGAAASAPAQEADEGLRFFKLPPAFAVLISPLGLLPYSAYVAVWYLSSVLAAAAAMFLLARTVHGRWLPENPWALVLPALAVVPFVWDDVNCGTCNLHILAFLMLAAYFAGRGLASLGGLSIGLAITWKAYPLAILPVLLAALGWKRTLGPRAATSSPGCRGRLLAWTCTGMVLWTFLVPGVVRGFGRQWRESTAWYQRIIEPYAAGKEKKQWQKQGLSIKNQSLYALTHRLLRPVNARYGGIDNPPPDAFHVNVASVSPRTADWVFGALVTALGAAIAVVCLLRPVAPTPMAMAVEFAIGACFILLVSPIAWVYFFALLLPALVVGAHGVFQVPPAADKRACIIAMVATFSLSIMTAVPRTAAIGPLAILTVIWLVVMLKIRWKLSDQGGPSDGINRV